LEFENLVYSMHWERRQFAIFLTTEHKFVSSIICELQKLAPVD